MKRDYLTFFEDWKNRWHKCILSGGDYFTAGEIDLYKKDFSFYKQIHLTSRNY